MISVRYIRALLKKGVLVFISAQLISLPAWSLGEPLLRCNKALRILAGALVLRAQVDASMAMGLETKEQHLELRGALLDVLNAWTRTHLLPKASLDHSLATFIYTSVHQALSNLALNVKKDASLESNGVDTFVFVLASLPREIYEADDAIRLGFKSPREILEDLFWQPFESPSHVGIVNLRRIQILNILESNLQGNPIFKAHIAAFVQNIRENRGGLSDGTRGALDEILERHYPDSSR